MAALPDFGKRRLRDAWQRGGRSLQRCERSFARAAHARQFQRFAERLVGGHGDVRLHARAFPAFARIRVESPADRDEGRIAFAHRSHAAEVGAAISDRPEQERAALKSYGRNLGIAFQLIDDALDYSGDSTRMGKSVGDDFREGKITLPVILAFLRGGQEERTFWQRVMEAQEQRPEDLQAAIGLMTRHGALKDTVARAAHYGAMAKDALGIFKESPEKRALTEVVDFCIQRGH